MIKTLSTLLSFLALLGTFCLSLAFLSGAIWECARPFWGHATNWGTVCSYGFGFTLAAAVTYGIFMVTATEEPVKPQ